MRRAVAVLASVLFTASTAAAAEPPKRSGEDWNCGPSAASILILGSYHMSNPGQDAINVEADDVLSNRRQREITALNASLARYAPTMVTVEAPYGDPAVPRAYGRFLTGQHTLSRNEIEQIGFQVARAAGLKTVTPIDYAMWMNGWTPREMEQPRPKPKPAGAAPAAPQTKSARALEMEARLRDSTVAEYLRYLNSEPYRRRDHGGYMDLLRRNDDSVYLYEKADLLTNWYKRNHRMMSNLMRLEPKATDRVLLLVGSGHLSILRQLAIDSADLCLADTDAYLS